MKLIKRTLLIFLLIVSGISAYCQKNISVTVLNESISFPFTRFTPMHPGIEIGTNLFHSEKLNKSYEVNAYIGGYHHESISNAFYLKGEYVYHIAAWEKLSCDLLAGLGYQHSFYPGELYSPKENGDYDATKQKGKPHAIANIGIGSTYRRWKTIEPFVKYEFMVESPFANGIPVIPHTIFKLGFNFKF